MIWGTVVPVQEAAPCADVGILVETLRRVRRIIMEKRAAFTFASKRP